MKSYPSTRQGWSKHYSIRFNKTQCTQAAILAMWYEFLYLAFGD